MKYSIYIQHVQYLRNSVTLDHEFWYTCVKLYHQAFFFIVLNFPFFGLLGGQKLKVYPKMENNNYIRGAPFLWNSIPDDHDNLVHLCKMMISPGFFFIFRGIKGVKEPKIAENDKKILSVKLHISGTIHHMILINGTHV